MSKLKVGDWVLFEESNEIGKVIAKCSNGNEWYIRSGPCDESGLSIVSEDYFIKLPINFKPFDVVLRPAGEQMRWDIARAPKKIKYTHFACVIVDGKFHVGINPAKGKYLSADFPTIEEAKDWLEHQYATMLAKARGLV